VELLSSGGQLQANKELLRRFVEAINKNNLDLFDELCSPNYVWHGEASPTNRNDVVGLTNFKKAVAEFTNAMPDLKVVIEDIVAEGDRVAVRYTESGTHTGASFCGMPPRGTRIVWSAVDIYRVEKGKLAEEWFAEDSLGVWKQLGIIK
jgi:steroid delta-isomerase-like uncharacterized protein